MRVNTLWIWGVEDKGRGKSNEKKRIEKRFVTSGGTHEFEGIYNAATGKRCLLFKNRSQVILKKYHLKTIFSTTLFKQH